MKDHHSLLSFPVNLNYADELNNDFRKLKFSPDIETVFRSYYDEETLRMRQLAILVGCFLWPLFTIMDIFIAPPQYLSIFLFIRLAIVMPILLVMLKVVYSIRWQSYTRYYAVLVGAFVNAGVVIIVNLGHYYNPDYPYEGIILIWLFCFFLSGMVVREAILVTFLPFICYIGIELFIIGNIALAMTSGLILFGTYIICAIGSYLVEFRTRESFLTKGMLTQLADTDSLTGIFNRRYFNNQCLRLWKQACRENKCLGILLLDIDHFKQYNDNYGHSEGDETLKQVASFLQKLAKRPMDVVARYGGEEFAVILYDINMEGMERYCQKLVKGVHDLKIPHGFSPSGDFITISCGARLMAANSTTALNQAIKDADHSLYEAKAQGRNQYNIYGLDLLPRETVMKIL
ncbi:GGDEF domain-containing protein [Spartinivicinus poritis]|uniref:diguanylate cyclase n=1 Tax=Spartinivicinus poritis TaxID=2994640 RepID=A0ABT5U4B3_9GAMM|nr:diguanylate cyclase [Spartinivicinus sp. A2-2]MDE1461215.1 GGDEF domain-containing protein [Spartinivicinus sp. A2-2]